MKHVTLRAGFNYILLFVVSSYLVYLIGAVREIKSKLEPSDGAMENREEAWLLQKIQETISDVMARPRNILGISQ